MDGLLYSQRSPCVEDNGDNAALHMPSPEAEGELTGAAVARGGRPRRRRGRRVTGGGRSGETRRGCCGVGRARRVDPLVHAAPHARRAPTASRCSPPFHAAASSPALRARGRRCLLLRCCRCRPRRLASPARSLPPAPGLASGLRCSPATPAPTRRAQPPLLARCRPASRMLAVPRSATACVRACPALAGGGGEVAEAGERAAAPSRPSQPPPLARPR